MRRYLFAGIGIVLLGLAALAYSRVGGLASLSEPNRPATPPVATEKLKVIAEGLEIPWEVAFARENLAFITERPGRVRVLQDGTLLPEPVLRIETSVSGEGGLQGLALHPDFATNQFVYLYVSTGSGASLTNRVLRYRYVTLRAERGLPERGQLTEETTVLAGIPGNNNHNGGRLAFAPDGTLYVATGDSQSPSLAQDLNSLAGKILRITAEGTIPADNPFVGRPGARGEIWSYGHRNPQGLAWNEARELFSTEHGPSGDLGLCCRDEVNLIGKGGNYGWPKATGDQQMQDLIAPILQSGSTKTWAPGGAAFGSDGKLYFAALRGQHLRQVTIEGGKAVADTELLKDYGRLRSVTRGLDGALYITTSNRDGRGKVQAGDDKIIRFEP